MHQSNCQWQEHYLLNIQRHHWKRQWQKCHQDQSVLVEGDGSCPISELTSVWAITFEGLSFFAEGNADWSGTRQLCILLLV